MPWWLWILVSVITVGLLLYFSPITVHVTYSRVQKDDKMYVKIKGIYGLFHYEYAVPFFRFQGLLDGFLVKTDTDNTIKRDMDPNLQKHFNKDEIMIFFHKIKKVIQHTFGMMDWLKDTIAKVHCTKLHWTTRIGIGDAADTAITTGLIWGMKSSILGYLFQFLHLDTKPCINVIPMYNQAHFSTECFYTAKIGLGHAIIAGLYLLVRILKVKGGIKAWQNILFKAS